MFHRHRKIGIAWLALSLPVLVALVGRAESSPPSELQYRDRGSHFEGTRGKPVGGHAIELVGAFVEAPDLAGADLPETVEVQFYLHEKKAVHLVVRERDPLELYWLDRVQPEAGWRSRTVNRFRWSTAPVLKPLRLAPRDLLVVARLGRDRPSLREQVAPIRWASGINDLSGRIYRFVFKTTGAAKTRHSLFAGDSSEPLAHTSQHVRRRSGVAFDIRVDASRLPEDSYRIVLDGYFLQDNSALFQEVRFFHAPIWTP